MQPIIFQVDHLPEKIQAALAKRKELKGQFVLAFKTFLKPNATVPLLWFAILSDGIILLNTHKTRSVYKEYPVATLNSVRFGKVSNQESTIELISSDILENDYAIPFSDSINVNIIRDALIKMNISVLK